MIDLTREGDVFVLTMRADDNRFNPMFLRALNEALDTVEQAEGPAALVTTGGTEKFYSNGLDLDWLGGEGRADAGTFVDALLRCFARLLILPVPTVAAINGHAFAAGGMMTLAHDYRIMREDRGYFCLPEIDLQLPLAPGMTALIVTKLTTRTVRDTVLTGARIGGREAAEREIVDEAVAGPDVLPRALALAASLASKASPTYGALKRGLYLETHTILDGGFGEP